MYVCAIINEINSHFNEARLTAQRDINNTKWDVC